MGAVLVPKLLDRGYRVRVIDLFLFGDGVLPTHPRLETVRGDIRDQALLKRVSAGVDAVIHLACISNDPSFELNPALSRSINYDCFEPLVRISKDDPSESVLGLFLQHGSDPGGGGCVVPLLRGFAQSDAGGGGHGL